MRGIDWGCPAPTLPFQPFPPFPDLPLFRQSGHRGVSKTIKPAN